MSTLIGIRSAFAALAVGASIIAPTGAPQAHADALPYEREIDSCVAAINQNIDLDGAWKVRHIIAESDREALGYELKIDTIVFNDSSTRQYRVVCVARGSAAPLTLRIDGKRV